MTNTGSAPTQVGITLLGLWPRGTTPRSSRRRAETRLTSADLWFTSAQSVPQGENSFEPRIGYVVQGPGATTPASNLGINSRRKAAFTYTPTIPPGGTAIVMTFVTVQGKSKAGEEHVRGHRRHPAPVERDQVHQPAGALAGRELRAHHAAQLKSATVKLKFKKTGQDTVAVEGEDHDRRRDLAAGLPVTVDFGGVTQNFVLNKSGSANNGGGNKFNLAAKLKNGVTKAGTGELLLQPEGRPAERDARRTGSRTRRE